MLHGTIAMDQTARLFEIFNVGITMEFLLFVFIADRKSTRLNSSYP